jgi:hypothetical protein
MKPKMITRVTKTEFETDDGVIHNIPFELDDPKVIEAASNYWNGTPHYNEQVWEYLTPFAKIISVEKY